MFREFLPFFILGSLSLILGRALVMVTPFEGGSRGFETMQIFNLICKKYGVSKGGGAEASGSG